MEAERWRRIEALCQAALEQPPEKRAVFLTQACSDDAQLRAEVQALLDQQADSFLESAPLSAIKALNAGAKLGNFEIVELLGRGGMGEVYRARDSRLKRDVAIKVLPAALAHDPDRIARFEREARAASALNHPNIVAVYDIGCDNGMYWIASELVRGDTLRRAIEAGPLPAPRTIEIAVQVAAGLAAAHAAGLVHRDLKPDNIMVTRDGQVKILDFGLAKQRRTAPDSASADLTDEGVVLGTAGYMSPEQVRGENVDQRSDLFSFGVILYEMLGGKRAFAGDSSVEVMNAILKDDPPDLAGLGSTRARPNRAPVSRKGSRAQVPVRRGSRIRPAAIVALFGAGGCAETPDRAEVGPGGRVPCRRGCRLPLAEPSAGATAYHRHGPDHQRRPGKRRAPAHRRLAAAFQPNGRAAPGIGKRRTTGASFFADAERDPGGRLSGPDGISDVPPFRFRRRLELTLRF